MNYMFYETLKFNQNLIAWCVSYFLSDPAFSPHSALSIANKPVWESCPPTIRISSSARSENLGFFN